MFWNSCCWRFFSYHFVISLIASSTLGTCAPGIAVYASALATLPSCMACLHDSYAELTYGDWTIQLAVSVCVSDSQHRCHAHCLCFDLEAIVA